jgi:hypothetical protein
LWIVLFTLWTSVEHDFGLPHIIGGRSNRPSPRQRQSAFRAEAQIWEV